MNAGDLVKRKPNPWMLSERDLEIGIIVLVDVDLVEVLWPSFGTGWISKDDLEKISESR